MSTHEHYLFVCNNRRPDDAPRPSCQGRGSLAVYAELKRLLSESGLAKSVARCCQSTCLDLCDHGPVVLVEPEHLVYGNVTLADVPEIVEAIRTGGVVSRLLVQAKPAEH